ncbi:Milk-clotting protease [Myxococcus hansupus]|uniref:Milk-clotting protease n=1 Tax=Pseudomyxococcus hansupus TaxID=1297742 RepID=A0A0H4X2R7_9BACT|nr:Milk-clotting protease [Myxococcus hansupus]
MLLAACGGDSPTENDEIVANLREAGLPAADISIVDGSVYLGHDAHVSLEASREMLQPGDGSQEHYRTTNIVGSQVTRICVVPTAAFQSISRLSQGLDHALANYNALGLRITFTRISSGSCPVTITATTMAGVGHSAGFPANGLPYRQIAIGTGLATASLDVVEHVITHALGHTLGLRHTDYFNPSISCGSGAPPSQEPVGVGAIHIPGTPSVPSPGGSIMNTCYPPDTDGEFTPYDIMALNFLF